MTERHPYFRRNTAVHASYRRDIQRLLNLGPWFWPSSDDWEALEATELTMGTTTPPAPKPGQTLLLTYKNGAQNSAQGGLWVLSPSLQTPTRSLEFLSKAQECWKDAAQATLKTIPYLWKSPLEIVNRRPQAQHVPGTPSATALDDKSFGLAFALAIASELLEIALPTDFAASATIDERGELGSVQGLEQKVDALTTFAPSVRRLFVAHDQENLEKLQQKYAERLEILPFKTLKEAFKLVFPNPESRLHAIAKDPQKRRQTLQNTFQLTAGANKQNLPSWEPLRDALRYIRAKAGDLGDDHRPVLNFSLAIATRHVDDSGALELPPLNWLTELPQPLQTSCLAHLAQNSASSGTPPPQKTLKFIYPHLQRGPSAFPAHLQLLGAMGRIYSSIAQQEKALEYQIEAIEGWFQRSEFKEISYPLSFAFRLAGGLKDLDAFHQLLAFETRWQVYADIKDSSRFFVDIYKARAHISFGDFLLARNLVKRALSYKGIGGILPTLAKFHLATTYELLDRPDEATKVRNTIPPPTKPNKLDVHLPLLHNLSIAAHKDDLPRAHNLIDELIQARCYPVQALVEHSSCPPGELPRYIADFHPY